jgi:hypothetical protein
MAVAGPVMKDKAPKPSSLPYAVERQKEFYAWLADYERKEGCKIRPWAYNRAVRMREPHSYVEVAP